MRLLLVTTLLAGCAPATYAFSFDLTDPGARNVQKMGQHDVLEETDLKAELLVDATSFQAIMLDFTNKTDGPVDVQWGSISIIGPDHVQTPLHPDTTLGPIEAGAKLTARLVPFTLPSTGAAAKAYDNTDFELVVPMVLRGAPIEKRFHLHARAIKL